MHIIYIKQRGAVEQLQAGDAYRITWDNSTVDRIYKAGDCWFSDTGLSSWDATAIGYLIETWD